MNIKIYINCIKNGCWKLLWKDIKYDWRWRNHNKQDTNSCIPYYDLIKKNLWK